MNQGCPGDWGPPVRTVSAKALGSSMPLVFQQQGDQSQKGFRGKGQRLEAGPAGPCRDFAL